MPPGVLFRCRHRCSSRLVRCDTMQISEGELTRQGVPWVELVDDALEADYGKKTRRKAPDPSQQQHQKHY